MVRVLLVGPVRLDPEELARKHLATREVGETEIPLEANLETDLRTDHPLVGKEAEVTGLANELLRNHRGDRCIITGVIEIHGQIAGFRIEIDGKKFYAPKKDFFIHHQYIEDINVDSPLVQQVRGSLDHWSRHRDYYETAWEGVEAFCFDLAKVTKTVGVQAAGWYSGSGMGGKNWRYVIPDQASHVAVNCHSLHHDSVWTLSTTIFSSREIDAVDQLSSADHWQRVLIWTWATAHAFTADGHNYINVLREYHRRISSLAELRKIARKCLPELVSSARDVLGKALSLPSFSIGPSYTRLLPNTVGRHEAPTEECPYSIITVIPTALDDSDYLSEIVRHEMIHYALGDDCGADSHGEDFQILAKAVGLEAR